MGKWKTGPFNSYTRTLIPGALEVYIRWVFINNEEGYRVSIGNLAIKTLFRELPEAKKAANKLGKRMSEVLLESLAEMDAEEAPQKPKLLRRVSL